MFFTYCKSATQDCGQTALKARGTWQSVSVPQLPYFYWLNATAKSYRACYFTISVDQYVYMDGAKINIFITNSSNMRVTVYGGTGQTNLSFVASQTNANQPAG